MNVRLTTEGHAAGTVSYSRVHYWKFPRPLIILERPHIIALFALRDCSEHTLD
jgi:hypothetical protein